MKQELDSCHEQGTDPVQHETDEKQDWSEVYGTYQRKSEGVFVIEALSYRVIDHRLVPDVEIEHAATPDQTRGGKDGQQDSRRRHDRIL